MKRIAVNLFSLLFAFVVALSAFAQDKDKADEAEKAWQEFLRESRPPGGPPPEWKGQLPSQEQIREYHRKNGLQTAKAADLAREFYQKYPDHPKAKEARSKEIRLAETSVKLGNTNMVARVEELIKSPDVPEEDRLKLRLSRIQAEAAQQRDKGMEIYLYVLETGAKQLLKEFPKRPEAGNMLVQVVMAAAQEGDVDRVRRLATEIEGLDLPVATKNMVHAQLRRFDAVGKPFVFIALGMDGKEINLENLRGKVVLIDFWASWCGPCMAEVPNLKKLYGRYRSEGFEIIGVNLDEDVDTLKSTVEKNGMYWLHHFDGANPEGGWARKYSISSIPTMWLIDKQGVLRELNAREDLEEKLKKLLAEKYP